VPFAELADVRLHYRFDGDDDAPVLMLSNSLGTDLAMWDPQVPYLAERYRVLRYDSRGHGRSEVTKGPYVIAQLARDTLGLLDYLRLRQVRFCGLSIGGMVGQWLGANAAKRFERLVLCNTAAQIGSHEIWNDRMDAVNKRGMAAIVDGVLARWYTAPFIAAAPDSIAATREMLLTTPASGYVACCAAVRDMDLRDSTSRITVPTLVIAGTYDMVTTPAAGRFLRTALRARVTRNCQPRIFRTSRRRPHLSPRSLNSLPDGSGRRGDFPTKRTCDRTQQCTNATTGFECQIAQRHRLLHALVGARAFDRTHPSGADRVGRIAVLAA